MSAESNCRVLETVLEEEGQRIVLRRELRTLTQRLLAPLIGISRGSLRKFLGMSTPGDSTRERIRQWCADRPEPDVPPGAVALAILAADFRAADRARVRRTVAELLVELFAARGDQPPPWLVDEIAADFDAFR